MHPFSGFQRWEGQRLFAFRATTLCGHLATGFGALTAHVGAPGHVLVTAAHALTFLGACLADFGADAAGAMVKGRSPNRGHAIERAGLYGRRTKWEHWSDSGSESSEKRCRVPEWPHSAARSVLSQLEGRLFGTEQTRGNLRVSGLLVRLGLIGTAYRIILPVLWRDPKWLRRVWRRPGPWCFSSWAMRQLGWRSCASWMAAPAASALSIKVVTRPLCVVTLPLSLSRSTMNLLSATTPAAGN